MACAVFGPADQLLIVDGAADKDGGCALYVPSDHGALESAPVEVQQEFSRFCAGAEVLVYHAPTATLALSLPGSSATLFRWSASPPSLQPLQVLLPGTSQAHQIVFSPDGQFLLLACKDGVVRRVDRDGRLLTRITGHLGTIQDIDIGPRNDRLLIGATESGAMIFDLEGELILPIRPRTGGLTLAKFLPDGDHILLGTTERTTRILPIAADQLLELARSIPFPEIPDAYLASYRARVGD